MLVTTYCRPAPVMLTGWAIHCGNITLPGVLVLIAVWYWGIRLTGNWAYTFRNLDAEDWRYTKYRTEQKPFIFQIINFFGLNMMPTIVVFLAMLPGLDLISSVETHGRASLRNATSLRTWIGFAVCLAAATIQLIADTQRHRFAKEHKGEVCKVGLWKMILINLLDKALERLQWVLLSLWLIKPIMCVLTHSML